MTALSIPLCRPPLLLPLLQLLMPLLQPLLPLPRDGFSDTDGTARPAGGRTVMLTTAEEHAQQQQQRQ